MRKIWALMGLLMAFTSSAAIEVYDFDNVRQEQQFHELSHTLRCPKCQNNSIADSNSALAKDLRQKVYLMTKEGQSSDEIKEYMVARYGNFISYDPVFSFSTAILWFGPVLVVLIGGLAIFIRQRKKRLSSAQEQNWSQEEERRLNTLLDDENKGDKH